MPPIISALSYTVTDTTIVATWTTDISADSNLFAGAKAAIDNGVAASGTSHQCIVTGLLPNTVYSCHVVSGATTGSSSNVTTKPSQNRILVTGASNGAITTVANAPQGDTYRSFVSSDGVTYMTQDDGGGFVAGTPNPTYNTQIGKITNETTMAGTLISLANYGTPLNTSNGTDGPAGAAMSNKSTGLFGLNGNLHDFVYRQFPPTYTTNRYCNVIKSTDHGATWNNFNDKSTFTAGGNVLTPQSPSEPTQFYSSLVGHVTPTLYAADDGTLGYNTAGNQIDGANAYVYMHYQQDAATNLKLMRVPRIKFDAQTFTFEYWIGPASPTVADFTNDANWTATEGTETTVLAIQPAFAQCLFVPGINSYVMFTWIGGTPSGTAFNFYSAPTPAGPWTSFFVQQNPTAGSQWYAPFPFHRDVLGNTLTDAIPLKILYQGEPSGGNYKPNWSTLTLNTTTQPANTFIQGAGGTAVFPGNVTSGNLLVIAIRSTAAVTAITDNLGDGVSWNKIASVSDNGGTFATWGWKFAGATGPCTITVTGAGSFPCIAEYHGPKSVRGTPPALKVVVGATPSSNTTAALLGDLVVGTGEQSTGGVTPVTPGSGYTLREQATFSASTFGAIEDALNSSGGTVAANWSGWAISPGTGGYGIGAFYSPSYSISGSAGVAGATVSYTGTASGSVVADASGNYTIPNLYPGSYTITPSLTGYTFSPVNSAQTVVGANITGVNFTPTQLLVATPTFSPVAGTYPSAQSVSITSTDSGLAGFAITYTTDGSTPVPGSHGSVYSGPITVSSTTTIKAVASATGYANSNVGSASYVIVLGGAESGFNFDFNF